jgi:hypothetical protein
LKKSAVLRKVFKVNSPIKTSNPATGVRKKSEKNFQKKLVEM